MDIQGFELRCEADIWTLTEYLDAVEILSTQEYTEYTDKNGKLQTSEEPLKERTEEFMLELWQLTIKRLSNIPVQFLSSIPFTEFCKGHIEHGLQTLNTILEIDYAFSLNNELKAPNYNDWVFERWVDLENKLQRGLQRYDTETDEIDVMHEGNRLLLGLTYGDMSRTTEELIEKVNYFNELPAYVTLRPYLDEMANLKSIKEKHNKLYGSSSSNSGVNVRKHNKIFGWVDVIRGLAQEGVFGTYIQVKQSPLMEVLEYLNCNTSSNTAEYLDMKAQQKQK